MNWRGELGTAGRGRFLHQVQLMARMSLASWFICLFSHSGLGPRPPHTHTHPRAAPPRAAPIPRLWVQVPSFQAGPRPEGCVTRGCSSRQSPGPWGPTCRWAGCDLRLPRPQPCCGSCDFVQRLCESAPRRICSLFQFCLLGDASFRGQAGLCSLRVDWSSSSSCCAPVPPGWVGCPSSLWGCVRE